MKIGAHTMIFWKDSVPSAIAKIAEAGCDSVEIWIEHLWRSGDASAVAEARRALERNGVVASVHGPINDLNITSPNVGIRKESIRQVIKAIQDAAELGAEVIVVHPGRLSSKHQDMDEHRRLQREALEQLLEEAERRQVVIGFENMEVRKELHTVRTAREMRDAIDGLPEEWLGITLDIAHLADTDDCIEFIRMLGPRIRHMHVSDALPDRTPHVRFGDGVVDLNAVLAELAKQQFDGLLSLEVFIAGQLDVLKAEVAKVRQAVSLLRA